MSELGSNLLFGGAVAAVLALMLYMFLAYNIIENHPKLRWAFIWFSLIGGVAVGLCIAAAAVA